MNANVATLSKNYTIHETGKTAQWPDHSLEVPGLGKIEGKQFVKDLLGTTGCEISINSLPANAGMPFYHKHDQNEEVYIFIQGRGEMQIDDDIIKVQEGSLVNIAPQGMRTWRNTGVEPLVYLIIQVKQHSLDQYSLTDGVIGEDAVTWPHD